MSLHEGQKTFIRESLKRKTRINVLTCANRWGKSALIACLHIWFNFYKLGIPAGNAASWQKTEYRTANISPHSANTEAVFKAIHQILTSAYPVIKDGKLTTNKCMIEWFYLQDRTLNTPPYKQFFDNNSYIEHRSLGSDQGDSLQGKPFGLITYDEGGRSDHLEQEMSDAILPRLMDWQGPFYILSTPSQGSKSILYYYKIYQDGLVGLNSTYTQTGSLRDNTFLNKAQIDAQYDLFKDDPLRDQILEGKFIWGGNNLFSTESINDALDDSLNDGVRYEEGHLYVLGTDTAIGKDEFATYVLDTTKKPFRVVRSKAAKGNSKSPQMHLYDFVDLFDSYSSPTRDNIRHGLETWNGESVRFYHDLPDYIKILTKTYGSWQPEVRRTENKNPEKPKNHSAKKADTLIALKKLLEAREIKLPRNDQKLIQQLTVYQEDDAKLQTDRVMALALACWLATEGQGFMARVDFIDW